MKPTLICLGLWLVCAATTSWGMAGSRGPSKGASNSDNVSVVRKVRECTRVKDCLKTDAKKAPKGRIEFAKKSIRFYDANDKLVKMRTLLVSTRPGKTTAPIGSAKVFEWAEPLCLPDRGVVVSREGPDPTKSPSYLRITHEVYDSSGNLVQTITGPHTLYSLVASPNFDYYFGWDSYGSRSQPYVFFNQSGEEIARHESVFSEDEIGGVVGELSTAFSPDGSVMVCSVDNGGIAVFNRDGTLRWKKVIPGWHPHEFKPGSYPDGAFFPNGKYFIVGGRIDKRIYTTPSGQQVRMNDNELARMVVGMTVEQRRTLEKSGAIRLKHVASLSCYSIDSPEPVWYEEEWGGILHMHPTKDLVASVGGNARGSYSVRVFSPKGLVRKWTAPGYQKLPAVWKPDLTRSHTYTWALTSWMTDNLVLIVTKGHLVRDTGTLRVKPEPMGLKVAAVFNAWHDKPLWISEYPEGKHGFRQVDDTHFAVTSSASAVLYEVR